MTRTPLHDTALDLAGRGWFVFPLIARDKMPAVRWRDESTIDPEQVDAWWVSTPDANLGIDCGPSKLAVVDIDSPEAAAALRAKFGTLPDTYTVKTAKGWHLYYEAPGAELRNSQSKLAPGVDIRAEGGFVVTAPSIHPSGAEYRVTRDIELAPFPDVLLDALTAEPEPLPAVPSAPIERPSSKWAAAVLEGELGKVVTAIPGQRNAVFFGAACKLYDVVAGGHLDQGQVETQLLLVGQRIGLEDLEMRKSMASAQSRAKPRHPEERAPAAPAFDPLAVQPTVNGKPPATFTMYDRQQLKDMPPPEWVLDDRLPVGLTFLYGQSGVGKTFVALDWCLTLASMPGRRPVLYFAGEGAAGIGVRLQAWEQAHPHLSPDRFLLVPTIPALLQADEMAKVAATVQGMDMVPELLVVDTLARALSASGGDENSATDVGMAIAGLDRLREAFGCSALVIHHTGKNGERERGSGAIRGAADAMWKVSEGSEVGWMRLECDKLKDGERPWPSDLQLRSVGPSAVTYPSTPGMLGL